MKKLVLHIIILLLAVPSFAGPNLGITSNSSEAKKVFALATEPGSSVSGLDSASRKADEIQLTWNSQTTNTAGYIILYQAGSTAPSSTILQDGTSLSGTTLGATVTGIEVSPNTESSRLIGGLADVTEYSFTIVPYNITGVDEATINYKTSSPATISIFTLATEPTASVTGLTVDSKTTTTADFSINEYPYDPADNGGYILYAEQGGAPRDISALEDGVSFNNQSTVFGSFSDLEIDEDITTFFLDGLMEGTEYTANVILYNSNGSFGTVNYRLTDPDQLTFWTLATEPTQAASVNAETGITSSTATLDWDDATGANKYLVLYTDVAADLDLSTVVDGREADALHFTANVKFEIVTNSTLSLINLKPNTNYTYWVVPYAQGTDAATINYFTSTAPSTETFTTDCALPDAQSTISVTTINPLNMTVNWDNTITGADRYLVVAKETSAVAFQPVVGDSYTTPTNYVSSDFSAGSDLPNGGGTNIAVYDGTGNALTVTGLDLETTYHFAVFAYNSDGNCYVTPASPGTASASTPGAAVNGTISFNSASTTINSVANDEAGGSYISILDFNILDNGTDGIPTELNRLAFSISTSDDFEIAGIGWDEIIKDARLVNITSSGNENAVEIQADSIIIDYAGNESDQDGEKGYIADNSSSNYQLQIRLFENISAVIDNKNIVVDLYPSKMTVQSNSSLFDATSSSISSGSTNNTVEVIASQFNFLEPTAAVTINATENFDPADIPKVEVTDENGNLDLDYTNGYTLSYSDVISVQNPPSDFSNGVLDFPTDFNYQGSGDGTLSIVDGVNSIASATSQDISVNPKITLSEIAASYNDAFLDNGASQEVLIGFDLKALSSADVTEIVVGSDQELTDKLSNIQLYASADDVFDGSDTNVTTASVTNNGASTTINFSSFTETISTASSYYFIVADVNATVPASTPDINFSLSNTGFTITEDELFPATSINKSYSFKDLTPPEVVSVNTLPISISDDDTGTEAFQITIEFDEEMLADGTADPAITFPTIGEDPSSSITFSPTSSGWNLAGLIYTAYYNVVDVGETIKDIDINIASAKDISGNTLIAVDENDLFSIDTQNPTATASLNGQTLVNQPVNTITLEVTFNEVMNTTVNPSISTSVATDFDGGSGSWNGTDNIYAITYNHGGAEEFLEDVTFIVSNALDTAGNAMAPISSPPTFDINTIPPKIEAITSTNLSGIYKEGDGPIEITIDFDENVILGASQTPQLTLSSGGTATFSSHTNDKIVFSYTILAGENANPLQVSALLLNGSTITNAVDNPADLGFQGNALTDSKNIEIDTKAPLVSSITSSTPDGIYGPGESINIKVTFDEDVQKFGLSDPTLTLNSGGTADFVDITNGSEINFTYTVEAIGSGENTADLGVVSINSTDRISDIAGNLSDLTLTAVNNTLAATKAIVIDTEPPTLGVTPFSPVNGSLNVSLTESFQITLNEEVLGAGTNNIRLVDVSDGTALATLDGSSAFSNSNATTLTFNSLAASLQDSTQYYFEFDAGAITDIAGNPLPAFTGVSNWSFTTFGPARIDDFSIAACVGEVFTISGQYFEGVSQILTDVESGSPFEITTFAIDNDNTISFTVPAGTVPGKITLNKINGESGNTDDASTTSETAIEVGPSSGQIELVALGTDVVCDVPGSDPAPVETAIRFDIVGGSGTYTVQYSDGVNTFTETAYNSGEVVQVNPPNTGDNIYSIVSIVDEDPDLNTCSAADNGTDLIITEYEQSEVEAGGTFDAELGVSTVAICLAEDDRVDLSDAALMGTTPTIVGDITDGEWTIVDGPSSGGGGFSSNFNDKTSTNLEPTYYPSLADASYGSITLRLTSDDPTAPNPCSRDFDEITIVFVNTISVNVGADINACIQTDGLGNQSVIEALSASLGGGATTLEWSIVDLYGETYNNTWGFAASATATTFTATSTLENPFYKASPQEIANGLATLSAVPTSGGCGGTPPPEELNININALPNPTISIAPANVCSGEFGVRFRMSASSTSSTFAWTITNEGSDTAGQNDFNQIDGSRTGNIILVDFKEVTTETVETITVKEINPITNCESVVQNITVTIKPDPVANITYAGNTTVSQGDPKFLLTGEGGQTGNIQAGGVFSGPGVVQAPDGKYYLDPSILNVTDIFDPADDHIITFTYTDGFSCSASETIGFNVYAENSSFQNLLAQYCVSDDPDTIFVQPSIPGDDFEVIGIQGPGITELGLRDEIIGGSPTQVFKAIFDPQLAYDENQDADDQAEVTIEFSTRERLNPSNVITAAGTQTVRANPLPDLEYEGPEYDMCTYDEPADLEALGSNNQDTYQFILKDTLEQNRLPANLIVGDVNAGLKFDAAPLDDYLDSIGQESIEIWMEYSYTNLSGCSDSETFNFIVYKQPEQPELNSINLCNVDGLIEGAVVTNYDGDSPNLELEWYTNADLTGEPIGTGLNLIPPAELFANTKEVKFYVARKNVNSSGEDDALCSSNATELTYRLLGAPILTWNKSSYGTEPIIFTAEHGENNVLSYDWIIQRITDDGLETIYTENQTSIDQRTLSVDFGQFGAGQYQVDFVINTLFNCNTSVSHQIVVVPEQSANANFSFNFNESDNEWVSSIDSNNSWEWNSPTEPSNIKSEDNLWITNAGGSYNSGERSYIYSPLLDIREIDKPVVTFDLWIDVIDNIDGLILEYSTDNLRIEDPNKQWQLLGNFDDGISSGLNWYESTGIRSRPGTDNLSESGIISNNIFGQGWSNNADSVVQKMLAKHSLGEIPPAERQKVMFRFQFKSNIDDGNLPDGVAFDNFTIESLNRNVLVEYFGDENLATDAQEMASLSTESDNSDSFSWVNYRVNEDDPLFEQSSAAMLSRIYQYDAYDAGGAFTLDGEMKMDYPFSSEAGKNDLRNSLLVASMVDLKMGVSKVADDQLSININYAASAALPENTMLFTMVLQKKVSEGQYGSNESKTYYNLLRKMLPSVEGVDLSSTQNGDFTMDYKASSVFDAEGLVLLSFIQNIETGEVFQSANISEVPSITYNTLTSNQDLAALDIQLYPNPAKDVLYLSFGAKVDGKFKITLFDLQGRKIKEEELPKGLNRFELSTERLNTGMYNLLITNEKGEGKMLKFAVTN